MLIFYILIEYIGYVLFDGLLSLDPKEFEIVVSWLMPKEKIEFRCCLGWAIYMRRYLRNFAKIATPIMDLGKFVKITWTSECHASFHALKKAMVEAPILRFMDLLQGMLVLWTNANDMVLGAILMQECKVIAYEYRNLIMQS